MTEHKPVQLDPLSDLFEPVFAAEPFTLDLGQELLPLFVDHYHEIATHQDIELKPRWDKYELLQAKKMLRVHVARLSGVPIGYAVWVIDAHLHYADSLQAHNDILFIDKPRRKGRLGMRLIQFSLEQLKAEGVQSVKLHIKLAHDWTRMAERLGFVKEEFILEKRLD